MNEVSGATNGESSKASKNTFHLGSLTSPEILTARNAIVAHIQTEHDLSETPRFSYITLDESSTGPVQRVAESVVYLPPSKPRQVRVRLGGCGGACIISDHELGDGKQPVLTPDDCILAEQIALQDKTLAETLANTYEDFDMKRLVCDPWSVHVAEKKTDDLEQYEDKRLVQLFLYYKHYGDGEVEHADEWNHYAHPISFVPMVDLVSKKLISIHDGTTTTNITSRTFKNGSPDNKPKMKIPSTAMNYHSSTMKHNAYLPQTTNPDILKPIEVTQPEGVSFKLTNNDTIEWYHWKLNVTYNYREGVVLQNVSYKNRPIMRRMSFVEMVVPYADKHEPFQRKCAFDIGDYGLGYCTTSLKLGCDCVGQICYLPMTYCDSNGMPYTVENAICIHEEDAGTLAKHVEYRTMKSYVRRNRKLVISFVATVVNYEYLFYFYLMLDGTIGVDVKLSGMLSTNLLSGDETEHNDDMPDAGTLVGPQRVNAQFHQHMFCVRMEPTIDGDLNRVSELNIEPAVANHNYGNEFKLVETYYTTESSPSQDMQIGRSWRISNHLVPPNDISKKPVSYRLVMPANPSLLTADDSLVSKRAAFATRPVWVTRLGFDTELFPAGKFPTQSTGDDDGIHKWIQSHGRDHDIVDQRLVVWCSFGLAHMPRVEDFPIMPCETVGIYLKPDGFFNGNPTLDVEDSPKSKSVACCNRN